ncbi:hypothetical protein ABIF63_007371 [Bradyrhizobium japonicum]|uniref:Uncharacterized protein n=1 Tax=Bradyrhizobium japonicum TaxID=375 RepID=A0ABV2S412_BRAJP
MKRRLTSATITLGFRPVPRVASVMNGSVSRKK